MEMIQELVRQVLTMLGQLGYLEVFIIVALEYACLPIPSEVVLPLIGLAVLQQHVTFLGAIVTSLLGGIVGSLICYMIGYYGGKPLLDRLERRLPKVKKSVQAVESYFRRYGKLTVLLTRLLPLTRTYISLVAGATKYNFLNFISYSVIGIVIWNTFLISLGYFIGNNLAQIEFVLKQYSFIVFCLVGSLLGFILIKRYFYPKSI
jgi:membrane protein DedA with SNARE-associated domain